MIGAHARVLVGALLVAGLISASASVAFTAGHAGSVPRAVTSQAATPQAGQVVTRATLPDIPLAALQNDRLPGSIDTDRGLTLGGVGSDLWRAPADPPGELWMVTDRGPNDRINVANESRRTFPVPGYTPFILRVRMAGSALDVLEAIPIVGQSGAPVTGLPNIAGDEPPYDASGQTRLAYNQSGLDVEGLVRTSAGDIWAVEEYGPSLVHIDGDGRVLRRFVPHGLQLDGADYPVVATLPAIVRSRAANRGFEGLTLSPDGRTLYLALQAPLSNPDDKASKTSRMVRILAFDIASEQVTAEYAYPIGWATEPKASAKPERRAKPDRAARPATRQSRISALAPAGPDRLLVLERTDELARLYLADLRGATNLLGSGWDTPATAPSLESLADPAGAGVAMLTRTLVANISALPELPEKIEGLAVLDAHTIAIANDNDFDIGKLDPQSKNAGERVQSHILTVRLTDPLP